MFENILLHPLFLGGVGGVIFMAANYLYLTRNQRLQPVKWDYLFPLIAGLGSGAGYMLLGPLGAAVVPILPSLATVWPTEAKIIWSRIWSEVKPLSRFVASQVQLPAEAQAALEAQEMQAVQEYTKQQDELKRLSDLLLKMCRDHPDCKGCPYLNANIPTRCDIKGAFASIGVSNDIVKAFQGIISKEMTFFKAEVQSALAGLRSELEKAYRWNTWQAKIIQAVAYYGIAAIIMAFINWSTIQALLQSII